MSKKFFIGLLVFSLMILNGGCGSDRSDVSVTDKTDVNAALKGTWASSTNGAATITSINADSNELDSFVEAFGELPSEVLEAYNKEQEKKAVAPVNMPVTRTMLFFDDCDVEKSSGTAKFTAIVIISDDSSFLPIFFNDVVLSTQRNDTNEWTATTPNGDSLLITMDTEGKINLTGKIRYLDYDCEFSTVINKNQAHSINPQTILDGTWKLDGTQSGGFLAISSDITAAIIPEAVSMYFNDTKEESSTLKSKLTSFYSLYMKTSSSGIDEETSLLQNINPATEGVLTKIYDDVYKFKDADGNESTIFVENTDEIFVFMSESGDETGQTYMFLPLKKVDFDLESALKKTWTASEGNGGGYMRLAKVDNPDNDPEIELLNLIDCFSFTLQNADLTFSDVTMNEDDTITATATFNASFLLTSKFLHSLGELFGLPEDALSIPPVLINLTDKVTMKPSGNFLKFDDQETSFTFISDTEVFLYIGPDEESTDEGKFVIRFTAN